MAVVAVATMAAGGIAQDPTDFADSPFLRVDPERIVLSEGNPRSPCGECHVSEFETWQGTEHAQGFDSMHRSESARDILRQMNLRVTKRQEALCMRCHYTVGPELKAIAGVSCESCHGPARDWIDVHNDWGDGVEHPDRESPEHRAQRIARAEAGGMLRPSGDLYAVAANCFECHTIPVEELVNQGGHKSGTDDFNLPERMGEIRHNFVHQQWGAEGGNREPSPERTRLMFVLGRILAYEYTLRGLAEATTADGSYYRSMHRRTVNARGRLEEVARAVEIPAVTTILELGGDAELGAGQAASLVAVADRIREAGQAFARSDDHPDLQALDPLVEGRPLAAAPPAAGAAAPAAGGAQPGAGTAGGAAQPGPAAGPGTGATPAAAPAVPELPGSIRSRPAWMSAPKRQYLGDNGECMGCHVQAEEWWFENPHDGSHEKLTRMTDRRAAEISTLYGIGPSGAVRADQICMNCHGTILNAAIAQPVGCEGCHGAAVDFLDPHQDGGNPQLGMNALKTAAGRAETCARCHHITDERLLAAGHPSGDHDPAQASAAIKHWPDRRVDRRRGGPYPEVAGSALAQAYQSAIASRPVPRVTVATLPSRPASQSPPAAQGGSGGAARSTPRAAGGSGSSQPPRAPQTPPVTQGRADLTLDLEPMPTAVDSLTTEDLLLLVKQRLERIHNAIRGSR